jgi:hypothetical protein
MNADRAESRHGQICVHLRNLRIACFSHLWIPVVKLLLFFISLWTRS